jgi:hypothetical protein
MQQWTGVMGQQLMGVGMWLGSGWNIIKGKCSASKTWGFHSLALECGNCCLHDSVVWPWGMSSCGDFIPDGTSFFPSNKQKKKEQFMIWQPIASMCHLTLKTPASFSEVDAFELDLEPPTRCAHLQGGCEPTCSNCRLKLSLKH